MTTVKATTRKGSHAPGKLSALELSRIKRPGRFCDGGGLVLVVQERSGGGGLVMSWLVRYQIDGRRREAGLGAYPGLSVTDARAHAADTVAKAWGWYDPAQRTWVRIDPLAVKVEEARTDTRARLPRSRRRRMR